jgi:hypothetical protein
MSKPLPARPDLEQLWKQAKDLLKSHKSGNPEALRRFREFHPDFHAAPDPTIQAAPVSLADAQLVLAREHGFASWPKLKAHVESILLDTRDPLELFQHAFHADDASLFARLLERYPAVRAQINAPIGPFDSPAITHAKSREMLDLLDADHRAPPIGWATFGSEHGWCRDTGDYPGVVRALVRAGARRPRQLSGTEPVKAVLREFGVSG